MPNERQKYDLESLWAIGAEFDENVQAEQAIDADPFAAYLKDFGKKTEENEETVTSTTVTSKTESGKSRYSKLPTFESKTGWHGSSGRET